jgi:hypothetical protein
VLVYLFTDQSDAKELAYSTDVTGRNIPRSTADTKWIFVCQLPDQRLSEHVMRHLKLRGFYIFDR